MMIKRYVRKLKKRPALLILVSLLIAAVLMLGLTPWTFAQDSKPAPLIPDKSDIYGDRVPSVEKAARIDDPVERYLALETILPDQLLGSDLSTSSMETDLAEVPAGSMVGYTIIVDNSGDEDVSVTMVDALPNGLEFVSHETIESAGVLPASPEFEVDGNEVTWRGNVAGGGYAELLIVARVDNNVPVGTKITNTAVFTGNDQTVDKSSTITVLEEEEPLTSFLPYVTYGIQPNPPDITNLNATRPNSQNEFRLSWTGGPNASHYIVEQSNNPNFSAPIKHDTGQNTFLDLKPNPSWQNDFYFRVRAFEGPIAGEWSDTINIVGAYYDDFNNPASNWEMRRSTHLDDVNTWYEFPPDYGRIVLEVGDKWDWGLVSPLAKAPEPPYVIEFKARFAQTPNEVAMGLVFGGDYPGDDCPDYSSANNYYRHQECFNTFYNPQWYWAGKKLHLIWQRVDELVWCPDCGGSPMKRRGDTENLGEMEDVTSDAGRWNNHRIEVRDGNIKYFAASTEHEHLTLQHEYSDTRYIDQPYFGVFAYAGEYTSSVAVWEYFSVTPMDN